MNRFYAPDTSATSLLLTDLAQGLAGDFNISVVACRYGMNGEVSLPALESIADVSVHRLPSTNFGKSNLWRKALDLLSFHCAVGWFLLRWVRAEDIVVLKTDPPLLQLLNTSLIRFKKGRVVNWLQDIYPEIAIQLGKFPGPDWIKRFLLSRRDRALKQADTNIAISQAMADYLGSRGIQNVSVIANWADADMIRPLAHSDNFLRAEWGLQDKFVVMYSGNFGRVHEFGEIVTAVNQLAGHPSIVFLFVGEGASLGELKSRLTDHIEKTVFFREFQPRELLGQSLGVADIHLVTLKQGMENLLMPSKICGILAAGRPIGYVGEAQGRIGSEICKCGAGFVVAHGEKRQLAGQIASLASDPERCFNMGVCARTWFERDFTADIALNRWRGVLTAVTDSGNNTQAASISGPFT